LLAGATQRRVRQEHNQTGEEISTNIILWIGFFIIVAAATLYLVREWNEAKEKRDVEWILRPYAGLDPNEKKPSAFPYLFK
jgi:LPXTG-motif cell wall-anchored protein